MRKRRKNKNCEDVPRKKPGTSSHSSSSSRSKTSSSSSCTHGKDKDVRGSLTKLFREIKRAKLRLNENSDADNRLNQIGLGRSCPSDFGCWPCACLGCDKIICGNKRHTPPTEINQNHFTESGHIIGYYMSMLYCFRCGEFFARATETVTSSISKFGRRTRKRDLLSGPTLRGIVNLGNTCFINCVLQVLVHTPMIFQLLFMEKAFQDQKRKSQRLVRQLRPIPEIERKEDDTDTGLPILPLFMELLREFQSVPAARTPVFPTKLLVAIWDNMEHLAGHRQQDAHEFFISMLNSLHAALLQPKKTRKRRRNHGSSIIMESPIDQIFLGRMQSEIKCSVCRHSRYIIDPFWDASIEILPDSITSGEKLSLTDLLHRFTKLESLDETSFLQCPCCAKSTVSTKQLSFKVLPQVICLHLKRFYHTMNNTSCYRKIKTKVAIPDYLDFSPFTSDGVMDGTGMDEHDHSSFSMIKDTDYRNLYCLYAIVNHSGSYDSGHYIAYVKKRSFWFKCDDGNVQLVSRNEAMESEGYLLLYKKVSSQQFSIFD